MKNSKVLFLSTILGASLLWVSCQKNTSDVNSQAQESNATKTFGLAPDDPAILANVPLVISSEFSNAQIEASSAAMASAKGKPVKPPISSSDLTKPIVSNLLPANGSTISGTVTISASATDNVGVTLISLFIDGSQVSSNTSGSITYSWNASSLSGNHTIRVDAKDAAGNVGTATSIVGVNSTVVVLPPPPTSSPSVFNLVTPPVGNQGNEWTCAAFASGYAARSIEQYYRTKATSYSTASNVYSPEYIYNQTKFSDCGSGTSITATLDLMKNKGVATWNSMPYSDANGCSLLPTTTQDANAALYKIGGYSKILNTDKVAIKSMISSNHPVIATIVADNSFLNAKAGFIWKVYSGSGAAGHALIICGYDDSKNAYKVMSSWGTAWGDAGYSWIDYDFFPTKAGAYTFVMNY
jgi:C1A family cysteine protease